MRTSLSLGLPLSALIVLAGCGGGTGHFAPTGDGGPGHPGDDGSPGDDIAPGDDIMGDDELPPPPFDGGAGIDPRCASGSPIGTGFACGSSGLMCPLGTITDCAGNTQTLQCFCDGKQWTCDAVPDVEVCPPPIACPDPATLYPGDGCNVPLGQQCFSTDLPYPSCGGGTQPPPMSGTCTCEPSGWSCPVMPTPCPVPAPCPDPYSVYPFTYCNSYGLTCPGNPTNCGGQIYYDALQCSSNNGWVSVATTSCNIGYDGGFVGEDAGFFAEDAMPATTQ